MDGVVELGAAGGVAGGVTGAGMVGPAGAVGEAGAPCVVTSVGRIEARLVPSWGRITRTRLVNMKQAARTAVARVKTLAVPRPVMKFDMPPPPMPSAPPSLFCISTTATSAAAIIR